MTTFPADIKLEYKSQTFAVTPETLAFEDATFTFNYAGIVSAVGDYFYFVNNGSDLDIVDISDRSAPSLSGTATVVDGLVDNRAMSGLVLDSTGQYLYVPNGNTSMYTLDLTSPTAPTLSNTLTVTTAATGNRHVIVRVGAVLYLLGDTSFQKIDISTPGTPTVSSTLSVTSTIGVGVEYGFVTPDSDCIMYPEIFAFSPAPAGQIGIVDISTGTPAEATAINLPDFAGASEDVHVSGHIHFADSIVSGRMWFAAFYNDSGNQSYFWMVYDKGATWSDAVLVSDIEIDGEFTPSLYLSNPSDETIGHGIYQTSNILLETRRTFPAQGVTLAFWELTADEIFPQLVTREGGLLTKFIEDKRRIYTSVIDGNALISTMSLFPLTQITIWEPREIVTTDLGWVDISAYLRHTPSVDVKQGISGTSFFDRVAAPGSMTLTLENGDPVGRFSPDSSNRMANFTLGAPIRLSVSGATPTPLFRKFVGRITSIRPDVDKDLRRTASITAVDAMDVLSKASAKGLQVKTDITAQRIAEIAITAAVGVPLTSDASDGLDTTPDVFPFAFDGIADLETSLIAEIQKATESERGYFYVAYQHPDVGSDGGFRLESRSVRIGTPVFNDPIGDDVNQNIVTEHASSVISNRVNVKVFPRVVDADPTTILFTLSNKPRVRINAPLTFNAPYQDPDEAATRVSGIEMQPPIAGTDYQMFTKEVGGTNTTGNLRTDIQFGGSSAEVTLTTASSTPGFVTLFRLKGRGIYAYDPVTVTETDEVSIQKHGLSDVSIDLPHQVDTELAMGVAQKILDAYSTPRTFIREANMLSTRDAAGLTQFLNADIGDKFFVESTELGIGLGTTEPFVLGTSELGTGELADEDAVYVIHGISFSIGPSSIHSTWTLFPASVRI